jgi:predicted secreted Zn-dependent protease
MSLAFAAAVMGLVMVVALARKRWRQIERLVEFRIRGAMGRAALRKEYGYQDPEMDE